METYAILVRTAGQQTTAVCSATLDVGEIGPWLATAFGQVARAAGETRTQIVGPPFARYHRVADGRFTVEAGFPVDSPVPGSHPVAQSSLPGGELACLEYRGSYDAMTPAYDALLGWVREHGEIVGDPWEVYLTDPAASPDPAGWRTDILVPFRRAEARSVPDGSPVDGA